MVTFIHFLMKVLGIITVLMLMSGVRKNKNVAVAVENTPRNGLWRYVLNKTSNEFSNIDHCMIKAMEETIKLNRNTYMFLSDGYYHQNLLQSLQSHFMYTYYTMPMLLNSSDSVSFNHLIIFRGNFNLNYILKQFMPYQGTKFFIVVKDYKEALKNFEILWKHRIVDVLVSFVKNKAVQFYTYFPYTREHCGIVGTPQLVAECYIPNSLLLHKQKLFSKKVKDLNGCPVNITFKENIPSSYYDASNKLTGWEVDLMNEIISHINGVPSYYVIRTRGLYHKENGYKNLVKNSDVGGGLAIALGSLAKTDFCMYGQSVCAVWVVPKRTGNPHSAGFLTKVFPPEVWALFLLVFFVIALAFRAFYHFPFLNILFKLLPFIFGMTVRTQKTSRLLAASWLWFCLIINAIYQSGYQSTILVPDVPPQLSTTHEILISDLKILGVLDVITDAKPYYERRYNVSKKRLRLNNRKFTYEEWIRRLTVKKDMAYLGFKEIIRYHIDRTELADKLSVSDTCMMKYMLAFILKKNSHLTEVFLKFAGRLNENGFVAFVAKKHLSRESRIQIPSRVAKVLKPLKCGGTNSPPAIDMDKMFVVFVCHFVGLMMAVVVFCMEKMTKWNWPRVRERLQIKT